MEASLDIHHPMAYSDKSFQAHLPEGLSGCYHDPSFGPWQFGIVVLGHQYK